jgi:hypothetical protein
MVSSNIFGQFFNSTTIPTNYSVDFLKCFIKEGPYLDIL